MVTLIQKALVLRIQSRHVLPDVLAYLRSYAASNEITCHMVDMMIDAEICEGPSAGRIRRAWQKYYLSAVRQSRLKAIILIQVLMHVDWPATHETHRNC